MTPVEYKAYFKNLATSHKQIHGFFRMNLSEIQGYFRKGIELPALVLESYDGGIGGSKISTDINRGFAFTIYLKPAANNFDAEDEKLSIAERIGLEIIARMHLDSFNPESLLFNQFDKNTVEYHKVGPIFTEGFFGFRFFGEFKGLHSLKVDPNIWKDLEDTPLANKMPKLL